MPEGLNDGRGRRLPIPANPDVVGRLGQVGQQVPTEIVGHDNLDKLGLQIAGLRDYPDPRLRPRAAPHDPPDVVGIDQDRAAGAGRYCQHGREANVAAHPLHNLFTIVPLLPLSSTTEPTASTSGRCPLCVELRLAMLPRRHHVLRRGHTSCASSAARFGGRVPALMRAGHYNNWGHLRSSAEPQLPVFTLLSPCGAGASTPPVRRRNV